MSTGTVCALCSQVAGVKPGDLLSHLLDEDKDYRRRALLETEHLVVFPSIGPLTAGHVLLCPKEHFTSFGRLPTAFETEYSELKKQLTELLETSFKAPVHTFEHGTDARCSRVLCTVEHAHQHFVPAHVAVSNELRGVMTWMRIGPKLSDLAEAVGDDEYILYQAPGQPTLIAAGKSNMVESQFMRRVFANALGRPSEWNWRETPNKDLIEATIATFRSSLQPISSTR